jgi:mono/diheme cytochrome c family protein
MKPGAFFPLLAVVLLGLVAAVAFSILHDGLSARAQPSTLEAAIAGMMRKLAMPSSIAATKNPVQDSQQVRREGMLHFADHCAICHGNDGSGATAMGRGMYPKPPDLRAATTQSRSDGELFWIIENGVRLTGMPAFGGTTPGGDDAHADPRDSWKLALFIRHLPALTAEERIEMEKHNPRGPDEWLEEQEENDFLNGTPAKLSSEPALHHH